VEILYRARNWVASAPTVLVVATALVLTTVSLPKPVKEPVKTPVKIQLTALPEPPPPEPVQPAPPPPVPVPPAPPPPAPAPLVPVPPKPVAPPKPIARPKPADRPAPTTEPTPDIATSAPTTAPTTASTAPAAAPAAPAAPAKPANASAEEAYVALLRADIETNKHYPNGKEARLARPHGDVEVWFRLDRSGAVKEAGVQSSSGSLILDQAALALVRGGNYPAFPAETYSGSSEHRFVVTLSYSYS